MSSMDKCGGLNWCSFRGGLVFSIFHSDYSSWDLCFISEINTCVPYGLN